MPHRQPPARTANPAQRVKAAEIADFRAKWADRATRDAAKASAVSLIARYPDEFAPLAGLDHPALVDLVDQARAAGDADRVTLFDIYLVGALPPQRITGAFRR